MHPDERLTAYADGELDTDEAAALEADLARDPALRARLTAIRDSDDALRSLPAVEPRQGFDERLRAAIDDELASRLDDPAPAPVSQLASRRRLPDWAAGLAGAAAAVALLGGIGYGVLQSGWGGGDEAGDDGAGQAALDTAEGEGADEAAGGDEETAAAASGPLVLSTGRTYDEAALTALAGESILDAGAGADLADDPAGVVARRYAERLGVTGYSAEAAEQGAGPATETAVPTPPSTGRAGPPARDEALQAPGVSDDELGDVRRCVSTVLAQGAGDTAATTDAPVEDPDDAAIPTYAELARFDGEPVVVVGLLTRAPAGDPRGEVWVLDRAGCQVRYFTQRQR